MRRKRLVAFAMVIVLVMLPVSQLNAYSQKSADSDDDGGTGRIPIYPRDRACSPLTSLYLSMIDVDGSARTTRHSGVDGGRLGDPILAPAPGTVVAVWRADWGWGAEGALMIRHSRADLGLQDGPNFYYSEFDHLRYKDIRSIDVGDQVERGEQLATVFRPGGKKKYLPEVHWEVWTVGDDAETTWYENKHGGQAWKNATARLIDPVRLLSLNEPEREDGKVEIQPFIKGRDYKGFRGFTYIFPCPARAQPPG
jgi:murein DD-endopeptidase MepM/ murein hydrolase activator NlpD